MDQNKKPSIKKNQTRQASPWNYLTRPPYVYLIFGVVIFLIYSPILSFYLGKLDENLIYENLKFISNFSNLKQAFFKDAFFSEKGVEFFRPLQNISYMVDAHFSGDKGWAYYLDNIFIHWVTCSALFYLLVLLGKEKKTALILSLLFAVSPLFVQNLAWAPSRGDMLIAMFGVLTFIFFIIFLKTGKWQYLATSIFTFALAMLSKETAVMIPFALAFYYFFAQKEKKLQIHTLLIAGSIYLLIIGCYLFLRAQVVKISISGGEFGVLPLLNNLRTIPEFISKFTIPFGLAPMPGFSIAVTLSGVVIIILLTYLIFKYRNEQSRMIIFGAFWFLIFVIPGIAYRHKMGSLAYDYLEQRAYLPSIGLIILLYFIIIRFNKLKNIHLYLLGLILVYGIYARVYSANYENPLVYYQKAVSSNPGSAMAVNNLGLTRMESGKDYNEAMSDFEKAIALKPDYAQAYVNKGNSKSNTGNDSGAVNEYKTAIKIEPDLFHAHFNLGNSYSKLGMKAESINEYNTAIKLFPTYYPAYFSRGVLKFEMKDYPGASEDFTKAISFNDSYTDAYVNRGKVNYLMNKKQEACHDWEKAQTLGSSESENLIKQFCN